MRNTIARKGGHGQDGAPGQDGEDGAPCMVVQNNDGTATITCPDGSSATIGGGGAVTGDIFEGSFTIANELDLQTFWPYVGITGDLTISAVGLTEVALPNLRDVGGDLRIVDNATVTSVALDGLHDVGGTLHIASNTSLASLSCSTTGLGALEITGNTGLGALTFPALHQSGRVEVTDEPSLPALDLAAVVSLGELTVEDTPALTQLDLGGLTGVARGFLIREADALVDLDLANLGFVGGELQLSGLRSLPALALNNLAYVNGDFIYNGHGSQHDLPDVLTSFAAPMLDHAAHVSIGDTSALTTLTLPALRETGQLFLSGHEGLQTVRTAPPRCRRVSYSAGDLPMDDHDLGREERGWMH